MSSMVSRRPPFSVSTSQANDFFWMSIRLGTSRDFSSRAKLRRVRGASTEAKTATPLGRRGRTEREAWRPCGGGRGATVQDSTGACGPLRGALGAHGPRPARVPYVAGWATRGRLRLSAEWRECSRYGRVVQRSDADEEHRPWERRAGLDDVAVAREEGGERGPGPVVHVAGRVAEVLQVGAAGHV